MNNAFRETREKVIEDIVKQDNNIIAAYKVQKRITLKICEQVLIIYRDYQKMQSNKRCDNATFSKGGDCFNFV